MKIMKLMCNDMHVGYRFFIDNYAYDCLNVKLYKEFGGPNVRKSCNVVHTNGMYLETTPSHTYAIIPASYSCIGRLIWMYNRGFKDIEKGKRYRYRHYSKAHSMPDGTVIIIDALDFESGIATVHTEDNDKSYTISMQEINAKGY